MENRQADGLKKIAILFLALGPSVSAKVLKHFSESEIERITLEVANTSQVKRERLEAVLDEYFLLHEARRYLLNGGIDYARDILERALGPQKAAEMMKRLKDASRVKPFTFVRDADIRPLAEMIGQEHPQTIAFILSYLDSGQAAQVISALPAESQSDIARRIALMERTSPEMLKGVESVMRERLVGVLHRDFTSAGGIPTIVEILNQVDRGTEKSILQDLEKDDAELAEQIRQQMFLFEDITSLDDSSIQRILRDLDSDVIALALKGASDEVKYRIFKNVSKRAGDILRENMEYMGPVRLREVEEAQQKVVALIRKLDESGDIILSRGGDDALVV